jgi:hypothetical protein
MYTALNGESEPYILGLPSDFPDATIRTRLGLEPLVGIEVQLREGQANDALESLREDMQFEYSLNKHKRTHARGTGLNTRANNMLQTAACKKWRSANLYIKARKAMIVLGCQALDPTFEQRFPSLDINRDLWMKDPNNLLNLGDGTRHESWIWQVGVRPSQSTVTPWHLESM